MNESLAEFIDDKPLFSDLLEDVPTARDLKDEKINEAFELIKSGRLDGGFDLFSELYDGHHDDPFLSVCWAVSPDYVVDVPSEIGLSKFKSEAEQILQLSKDATNPVKVPILGFCLLNLYLEGGTEKTS